MSPPPDDPTRRDLLRVVTLAGVTLVVGCPAPGPPGKADDTEAGDTPPGDDTGEDTDTGDPPRPPPTGCIFVSVDEQGPDLFSHRGHPEVHTPELDRLAAEGVSLSHLYTAAPICAPTRQSLLTGLFPQEHGQLTNGHVFHQDNPTLAGFFTDQGLATACFGKLHTQNDESLHTFGFQRVLTTDSGAAWDAAMDRWIDWSAPRPPRDAADDAIFAEGPVNGMRGRPLDDLGRSDDWVLLQEALAWLREHREERFFLYLSFRAPHYPWDLPREHYYRFDPAEVTLPEVLPGDRDDTIGATWSDARWGWSELSEPWTRLCLARYLGAIEWVDRLMGELRRALEELGILDTTLLTYTSDHGEMAGAKGLWLKSVHYDPACRKPFIARLPGTLPAGGVSGALVSEVDLWPTVAGLMGLGEALSEARPALRGVDRSAALLTPDDPSLGAAQVFSVESLSAWDRPPWQLMCRGPRYKLIRYRGPDDLPSEWELYDMEQDPGEQVNLHGQPDLAEVEAELDAAMDAFLASIREPAFPVTEA